MRMGVISHRLDRSACTLDMFGMEADIQGLFAWIRYICVAADVVDRSAAPACFTNTFQLMSIFLGRIAALVFSLLVYLVYLFAFEGLNIGLSFI